MPVTNDISWFSISFIQALFVVIYFAYEDTDQRSWPSLIEKQRALRSNIFFIDIQLLRIHFDTILYVTSYTIYFKYQMSEASPPLSLSKLATIHIILTHQLNYSPITLISPIEEEGVKNVS